MSRSLAAALSATLLLALPVAAFPQVDKADQKEGAAKQSPPAQQITPPAGVPGPAPELDAKTRALIQAEVDKAKQDIRNEVRAEIQGAQSAAEFLGAVSEGPKLEFVEWHGYFRVRGELFDNLDLGRPPDASGYFIFPKPLQGGGTLATANMRLRLEPTFNISEHVRIRTQFDILDNYVLGSSVGPLFNQPGSPYPVPFYGSDRVIVANDPTADRPPVIPKRVWGEVQTPVGLLSFGRMPSQWGLGILANAGSDIDNDFGDSVDRIQFALPPVPTPLGNLAFVPILDFDGEGPLYADPRYGPGLGQPFDAEQSDDARTYGIKIARIDTGDEIRRKLDTNESSLNYGLYYNYRTERWFYPTWYTQGYTTTNPNPATPGGPDTTTVLPPIHRRAYAHFFDLWARYRKGRMRLEAEGVFIYGQIGDPSTAPPPAAGTPASPLNPVPPVQILLRQWGGVVQFQYDVIPNKLTLGAQFGAASGDGAPGFGNQPYRLATDPTTGNLILPPPGSFEGPQWGGGDRSIRNFRFNPAYHVDLVLYRQILGTVTDSWYLTPTLRWDIFPGLRFDFAAIYSQAMYASSTPSAQFTPHKMLGIELDGKLSYTSGDGFVPWFETGVFQPLDAFGPGSLSRAWVIRGGLAIKF